MNTGYVVSRVSDGPLPSLAELKSCLESASREQRDVVRALSRHFAEAAKYRQQCDAGLQAATKFEETAAHDLAEGQGVLSRIENTIERLDARINAEEQALTSIRPRSHSGDEIDELGQQLGFAPVVDRNSLRRSAPPEILPYVRSPSETVTPPGTPRQSQGLLCVRPPSEAPPGTTPRSQNIAYV